MIASSTNARTISANIIDHRNLPEAASVDPGIGESLKQAMRRTASTIAVVTARGETESRGVTVSTFTMVSLDPAIVSFSLQRYAQMEEVLRTADRFHVHILKHDQAALARRFASRGRKGSEQFGRIPVREGDEPRLSGVLATITAASHSTVPVGDHTIVLGQVIEVEIGDGRPLLYHDRSYRQVGERVQDPGTEGS